MADTKGSALTALTALTTDDLFIVVDDPGGTPVTKKITVANVTAAQADQETGTSAVKFVTPSVQQYHPSACKVWAAISGDGATLQASYNVTSITDTGAGDVAITIATDFSSANWAAL